MLSCRSEVGLGFDQLLLLSAGGCPLSHQVLTYSVPNTSDVCVPQSNGTYVAELGNPSNNYTCGADAAQCCSILHASAEPLAKRL